MVEMPLSIDLCLLLVSGSLGNKVERKLQQCLPYLSKSISQLISKSGNPEFQHNACALMSCQLDCLQQEVEYKLEVGFRS